jgi:hypothetical protein
MAISRKLQAFLGAYEECGCIIRAAQAVGIDRSLHYRAMDLEPDYPAAFKAADKHWFDKLEGAARHWASEGVEEAIFRTVKKVDEDGNETVERVQIGTKLRIPQTLIVKLLEAGNPAKYRPSSTVEHTGADGRPIELQVTFVKPGQK